MWFLSVAIPYDPFDDFCNIALNMQAREAYLYM
jgi:hypothetical protein